MRDRQYNVYETKKLGGDTCWYCGITLIPQIRTMDHFWPKSMRGRIKVSCCLNCNRLKKNLTPNGFVDLLKELKQKSPAKDPQTNIYDRMIFATETLWVKVKHSI